MAARTVEVDVRILTKGALLVVHVQNPEVDQDTLEMIAAEAQRAGAAIGFTPEQVWVTVGDGRMETWDDERLRAAGLARLSLLREVVVAANRLAEANEGDDAYRAQRWREMFTAVEAAEHVVYPL